MKDKMAKRKSEPILLFDQPSLFDPLPAVLAQVEDPRPPQPQSPPRSRPISRTPPPEIDFFYLRPKTSPLLTAAGIRYREISDLFVEESLTHDRFGLIITRESCYKCYRKTTRIAIRVGNPSTTHLKPRDCYTQTYVAPDIEHISPHLLKLIQERFPFFRRRQSNMRDGLPVLANTCEHCNAPSGHWYEFIETDGCFHRVDKMRHSFLIEIEK